MTNNVMESIIAMVINKMSEPHRKYHSYENHIEPMLLAYSNMLISGDVIITYKKSIWLAIMFHDFEYSTNPDQYAFNEDNSIDAMYLNTWNLDEFTNEERHIAAMMIAATKTHTVDGIDADSLVLNDIRLFLDLDMMIFSKPRHFIIPYENQIRQEYIDVPDTIYYPARMKLLASIIEKRGVYKHVSNQGLNSTARDNIEFLIDHLYEYYMREVYK